MDRGREDASSHHACLISLKMDRSRGSYSLCSGRCGTSRRCAGGIVAAGGAELGTPERARCKEPLLLLLLLLRWGSENRGRKREKGEERRAGRPGGGDWGGA